MFGRHRQAQAYLDKAQETHKRIEVCGIALSRDASGMLSIFPRSVATHLRPVLAGFGSLYSRQATVIEGERTARGSKFE